MDLLFKIYMVLALLLGTNPSIAHSAPDPVSYEQREVTFVSYWDVEGQPITCLEDEVIEVLNGAEMDAYLLDGVYYERCDYEL